MSSRAGYCAIVGEPNVGKSTLLNAVIGQRLSIVSPRPQTTRRVILGIFSQPEVQIVFCDTPGVLSPKYLLQEMMMGYVSAALRDANVVLAIVDATKPDLDKSLLDTMPKSGAALPMILAINKIDLVPDKKLLLPQIEFYHGLGAFAEIFPISARKRDGIDSLVARIVQEMPEHPPFYPEDVAATEPERFFVAELIRESIFRLYREEVPYSTEVSILEYKERESGKWYVSAEIYVEKDSQKAILIGKKGEAMKNLGQKARIAIERFIEHPVYLELHVKVREDWRRSPTILKSLGYH